MLRKDQNDLLTQTGPGTPMGEMFRCYWIPALLAEELPDNDCAPVRVKLLGERLLAFRDSEGRYGLIDEFCAHRGVSLWFGRNEQGGLRCPYHGWKYDRTGQCVEVPSEPKESGYCGKIKLKSYPLIKIGDILWTYMGPAEKEPPHPEWEFSLVPSEQTFTSKRWQECNWLQAMEGGIDSSHVSWLHSGSLNSDPLFKGARGNKYNMSDARPFFEVTDSEGGLYIGARRNAEEGHYYWRVTPWVMPSFTMVPPRGNHPVHGHFWIPIDDENCWAWSFDYRPERALTKEERQAMIDGKGIHVAYVPGTYRPLANKDNDYLMDREAQRKGTTYSGVEGIAMQDASLQESMGPIVDRSKENLVSTDNGIIMARHRLMKAARALRDKGTMPPGVDPAHHRVRSAAIVLPVDKSYVDVAEEALVVIEGKAPTSV
ncbi:Phthalate 4,5-dioxygenase oxygenase subunit [Ensifer adhaerens]|uniref:Phenylpropionate dioxygenase-like ring-hydroxylating dioxygenase large terminal subunit n=1 Tax=Ensifer adhaerens TaxID=106592 RepID=A0ACC5T5B8_ENSAD|nr:aromatic ring-hydroxylating dioxygenase subunit alpha [Ensifer adhaerens]MBP1876321.1 phenylpropionate dioxygenase-like ring-hydroxylating dioxygenase large terminal subunit [Ensifer adhaerens]NRP21967.1 Phthalate 4,5-dioxygenase oxygenase subunit [Ensifer adhaerens]